MQSSLSFLEAKSLVEYVVDDAGCGRHVNSDPCAIIRNDKEFNYKSRIVGWSRGEAPPLFVAVHSYLDVPVEDDEAIEMAYDFLNEIGMVVGPQPDWIL